MTHITQEQARELAESAVMIRDGYWQSDLVKLTEVCNAAIDHYLSTLSAELPEPAIKEAKFGGYDAYTIEQLVACIAKAKESK